MNVEGPRFEMRKAIVRILCLCMLLQGPPLLALQESGVRAEPDPEAVAWIDGVFGDVRWPDLDWVHELPDLADALGGAWFRTNELVLSSFAGASQEEESGGGGSEKKLPADALAGPPDPPSFERAGERAPFPEGVELSLKAALDEIPLVPGWNLLSVPEAPAATDPAIVLESAGAAYSHVNVYDGCDPADPWKRYVPDDPEASDLQALDHTLGFWLDAILPVDLHSDGVLPATTTFRLCAGWNLIGFPAAQARPVPNALASIDGKYVRLMAYEAFDPADPWKIYDVNVPGWANDLEVLEPGRGYWILVVEDVDLTVANEGPQPVVSLTVPEDLAVVTAPTDVLGTVQSAILENWTLSYRAIGDGDWVEFASGVVPVTEGKLGVFDPTLLLNGLYEIRLQALDYRSRTVADSLAVSVEGNMKIGHFTLSFTDLLVPVSGLDVQVTRSYDSRDKEKRDFGVGWTLELRQGSYTNNRPPGEGWQIVEGFLPCDSIQETKSHTTIVRLSDREIYRFKLSLFDAAPTLGGCFAKARFDFVAGPLPGTTLEVLGNDEVFYENASDQVIDVQSFTVFEPPGVRLTTRDGRIFDLDLHDGVTRLEDQNGNELRITPSDITHSSGKGVEFVRDAEERIARIVDPSGEAVVYEYDAAGDLVAVTDREGHTTRYTYDGDHRFLELFDPLGRRPLRNDYDDEGRLVRVIDAFGRVTELGHDLEGRREVVTDRLGHARILEYDERGNVVRKTDALGKVTVRIFDEHDNLVSETDPLGHTVTMEHNANNNLTRYTDQLGQSASLTYDERNRPLTYTSPSGHVTAYEYDASGNITKVTTPLAGVITSTYDTRGNVLTRTNAAGEVRSFEYDGAGNVVLEIDPLGTETRFTYNDNNRPLSTTLTRTTANGPEVLVETFSYDKLSRLVETVYADGSRTRATYDAVGSPVSQTDELGRITTFAYDALGQMIREVHPDGTSEIYGYDAEHRPTSYTGRAGRVTLYAYDALGRLGSVTFPDGSVSTNEYDAAGRLVGSFSTLGHRRSYVLDAAGRQLEVTDALGGVTKRIYDTEGNVASATDALGNTTAFEYNAANQLVRIVFPDGTEQTITYNEAGRRLTERDRTAAEVDQAGRATHFDYDGLGRIVAVTDALVQVTRFAYDELSQLVAQTDANGRNTRFEYDRRGRETKRVLPDGKAELRSYDEAGNLAARTDFGGRTTTWAYDENNRVVERRGPGGETATFTYTPREQRASVTDARGTTAYLYNERNRLVEIAFPAGERLSYGYDARGNRTEISGHIGETVLTTRYGYDALDRLVTVIDPESQVYAYSYDGNGDLASVAYPNGVVTTFTYDAQRRLSGLVSADTVGETFQSYVYELSPNGLRTRVEEHDRTVRSYSYDGLDRLLEETVSRDESVLFEDAFTYDPVGNRLQQIRIAAGATQTISSQLDSRDRLLSQGGTSFSWDDDGRLTERAGATAASYAWDFEDRLESVTLEDGTALEHTYDVDGNRIGRRAVALDGTAETTRFLVDPSRSLSQVVLELDEAGEVTAYYVRGPGLLAVLRSGERRFFHADGLGSVRVLTDETGTVTDRYTYSAFGELLEHDGEDPNLYLFTGEPFDAASGLYYLRARWTDPSLGTFLSEDPFRGFPEVPATLHRYLYANADPVNIVDPTGRFGSAGFAAGLGIAGIIGAIGVGVVRFLSRPAQVSGVLFGKIRPIIVSTWNEAEVLTHLSYARSILNKRAEIILRWGSLETPRDLSEETQNFVSVDPTKTEAIGMARSGFNELGIVPVYFVNSLAFQPVAKGVSAGDWDKFTWRGSLIPWQTAVNSILALAHELGHSLGDLDDLWCIPPNPVLKFSPFLMASDCTFQGDTLNVSERVKWRSHMKATP